MRVAIEGQAQLLAGACMLAYVARASLLTCVSSSQFVETLAQVTMATVLLSGAYLALAGLGEVNRWGVLLIAVTGISLWHCERFELALPRWVGWVVMMWALGPVNSTSAARLFRRHMVGVANHALLAATLLSALWWAVGMPNLGRGDFTGVMWHSMVLGPIAAYVGVWALARVFTGGSLVWIAVYAISGVVTLLASSRAALAAMTMGSLIVIALKMKKHLVLSTSVLAVAGVLFVAPEPTLNVLGYVLPTEFTQGLANKNWNNSREAHWGARWDEFLSSPFHGVGFASAWEGTVGVDEASGTVESGSSYLAVLSMTGCVGIAAFAALAVSTAGRVVRCWHLLRERQRIEICGAAGFWFVHLGAEGYIYAVGSLLGVTFWLWAGRLNDQLIELSLRSRGARR